MFECENVRSRILGLPQSSEEGKFLPRELILQRLLPSQDHVINILGCPCGDCKRYRNLARRGDRDALHERPQLENFSSLILENAVSLFTLLASLKKAVLIIPFLRQEKFDQQVLVALADSKSKVARRALQDVLDEDAVRNLDNEIELNWTTFLRPVLSGAKDKVFPERQMLPIFAPMHIDAGASSTVRTFKVYKDYNQIAGVNPAETLVRKELTRIDHEEVNTLWDVKEKLQHPNIVRLLTSYEHRGRMYLVFPRSTTNLRHFLRDPRWGLGQSNFANVFRAPIWKETTDMIHALDCMHTRDDTIQMHHDLKPENILVDINRYGFQFLISDFGLSVKRDPTKQGSKTRYGGGDVGYRPPEDKNLGRSYDIWSMGCIILEILVFVVWGFDGSQKLDDARGSQYDRFWDTGRDGNSIKPKIQGLLNQMKNANRESNISSQALSPRNETFIQQMARLVEGMLRVRSTDRLTSTQVLRALVQIREGKTQIQYTDIADAESVFTSDEEVDEGSYVAKIRLLERRPTFVGQDFKLEKPLNDEIEIGVEVLRNLRGLCARSKSYPNREDEPVALQMFLRTFKNVKKLRFVLNRLNEGTPIEQRASLKSLHLVPAYALRERHNVPRYLAGLRLLEDAEDEQSGLSHHLDGELDDLRKIHGLLLNQEICHSAMVHDLVIQLPRSRNPITHFRRGSTDEAQMLASQSLTVQLWREMGESFRECRVVFYINNSKIVIVKFTEALGFERETDDVFSATLKSYLNKGASSARFTVLQAESKQQQPAFPLDPEAFRKVCLENQENLQSISMTFGNFEARREFLDVYKGMKRIWEAEVGAH